MGLLTPITVVPFPRLDTALPDPWPRPAPYSLSRAELGFIRLLDGGITSTFGEVKEGKGAEVEVLLLLLPPAGSVAYVVL